MLDINLNLYKVFYVVAKSKSYSEAGDKLNISIQAISKNIKQLENILDTQLFFRKKEGIVLTNAGKELFKYIDIALSSVDFGERITFQKNDLSAGEVIIGCPSHLTTFYLMNYIEKARIDYPSLKIKLISGFNSEDMIKLLLEHKIDFIIDTAHIEKNYSNIELEIEPLKKVENIFISKQKLRITNLKELETLKFILNFEYTSTIKNLAETLREHDILIKPNIECDITEVRIECVKRNLGIGYVMKDAVKSELENKELYEVELPIKLPISEIKLIYIKEQLTNVDKKFIKKYLKS